MTPSLPAIRKLLEALDKQGQDTFGFIHYIEKELYEDAKREYEAFERRIQRET